MANKPTSTPENLTQESLRALIDNPDALINTLQNYGTFDFKPYESGLFPASDLPPETSKSTGMGMAWLRDNAHVIYALSESGLNNLAVPATEAMIRALAACGSILDAVINHEDPLARLPVRFDGVDLTPDDEPRVQHDATGYALWIVSLMLQSGQLETTTERLHLLDKTIGYLDTIKYWQDPDQGHWEEDNAVHATSIGVVLAGLRETRKLFASHDFSPMSNIAALEETGRRELNGILNRNMTRANPPETVEAHYENILLSSPDPIEAYYYGTKPINRPFDAAILFLIEPLNVIQGDQAEKIVEETEDKLKRELGFIRYIGDTYWMPHFPSLMSIEERTTIGDGRLEARNAKAAGIAFSRTEAQWTLFDPVLSTYWGNRFKETNQPEHREKQREYLKRSLAQLVLTQDNRLVLPEAYYWESFEGNPLNSEVSELTPNPHTPLLWSMANLRRALHTLQSTQ